MAKKSPKRKTAARPAPASVAQATDLSSLILLSERQRIAIGRAILKKLKLDCGKSMLNAIK